MKTVKHYDRGELSRVERTPQGFLRAPAFVTRTGVLKYRLPDGKIRRELRLPEEVEHEDSLKTLKGIPVTNMHPPEMLNAKNTKQYMVGYSGEQIEKTDGKLGLNLTLTDATMIAEAEHGDKKEVSCGYTCDLEILDQPKLWNGEYYDAIQRNIRYNHIAIVDRGRAGPQVKLRLDADTVVDEEILAGEADSPHAKSRGDSASTGGKKMKVTLAGKEFEVPEDLHAALMAHMEAAAKGPKGELDSAKAEMVKKDEQVAKLQGKCDALEAEAKTRTDAADPAKVQALVKARMQLEKVAGSVLAKDTKLDSMSDKEIKLAVIKAKSPDAVTEGKTDAYLDARFDHIAETVAASDVVATNLGKAVNSRKDTDLDDADKAREKARKDSADEYKKPLSAMKE